MFHSVPDGRPSGDRVHLTCWPRVVADADRLKSLGAKQIRSPAENNNRWISFADPVGTSLTLVAG
jgi:hypothetical protein